MTDVLLAVAAAMQAVAVLYGVVLLSRHQTAAGAWLFLLGAMLSMLVWRIVMMAGVDPPWFFNPAIAIWGSTCMVAAMFLFGREVARRQRAEAERDALLASERGARQDAERANRLKDDFLATLSHELRTPLAAILSWCAVLRRRRDDRVELERALETIERSARAQVRLVDDLLDVTRMRAGTLHLELVPTRLDGPVRAAIQTVLPTAEATGVSIELRCDPVPPLVCGDPGRLQQVAANLLVNAVKFTPRGGQVTVSVATANGRGQLTVHDTGEGIDPAFLPHVFAPFRQADGTPTRRHGGLGLGLAIVATLVRLHGGEVRADSAGLGRGATFTVTLPLAPADATVVAHAVPDGGGDPPVPGAGLHDVRVLLVDDEVDVRAAISALLVHAGARVLALDSGLLIETALAEFRPDVLLLDIGMPGEDGYALLRRIRTMPAEAGGHVPAVSFTAHARDEDRARAAASGFQRHLPKPVDVALLVDTVRDLAGRPGAGTPPGDSAGRPPS